MDPIELERQIGEALRRLPSPRAPRTFVPRVMAAAGALRTLPWYRRPWSTWPLGAHLMSAAAAIVLVIAGALFVPAGFEWAAAGLSAAVPATADRIAAALPPGVHRWIELGYGAQAVWRTLLAPFVLGAAAVTVAMGTVFAAGAAVLTQLALRRASA